MGLTKSYFLVSPILFGYLLSLKLFSRAFILLFGQTLWSHYAFGAWAGMSTVTPRPFAMAIPQPISARKK